ncbi:MAG: hypothetical protein ACRCZM_10590 [Bacteroidales bacterium]
MITIEITRSRELLNSVREYSIYIDDKLVGSIYNGRTVEFNVLNGEHRVRVDIDWLSSQEMIVSGESDQTIKLVVSNSKYITPLFWTIIMLPIVFSILCEISFIGNYAYLLLLIVLFPLYMVTIGRKRYLSLRNQSES